MDCLDANLVQDLMSGALDEAARVGVLGHLDVCRDCRELLGVTARDSLRDRGEDPATSSEPVAAVSTTAPRMVDTVASSSDLAALATTRIPDATEDGLARTMSPEDLLATPTLKRGSASQAPTAGQPLGRYMLLDRLGAGAMGVVWRAEDPMLGRQVALKVLRKHDDALTERLVREAQSMAQVNHPNVVTVYEVGESAEGMTFIAMELVSGESLRGWQTKSRHTVPELVEAYIASARGLAAAHAAGIIHRDFKPDNVLVGDDGRIHVTDFGLAAAKPTAAALSPRPISDVNLTTSGSVLGTPAYMAPEQFTGGNIDPRTDQFNFCVALYEALYGERPFDGATFSELGDAVCEGRHRPAPVRTEVSSALRAIVMRGLSVKPGDRFPTMDELIRELGRDRARPWRRTALCAAAVAAALGLGLTADWVVRNRIGGEIRQSFALTGAELDHAVTRLTASFDWVSAVAYREQALREVAGHHDQADFGLGNAEDDQAELEKLHNTLVSTEWIKLGNSELAIADYKGRLLYTSAAPSRWGGDLRALAPVKQAIDAGKGDSVTVLSYADPGLSTTGVLGDRTTQPGLVVLFERTVALGDKASEQSEARVLYLQLQDGKQLLDDVRLDPQTLLAVVAPDGTAIADRGMTSDVLASASASGDIVDVQANGHRYQVQSRAVHGLDGKGTIARVVMARSLDGVLSLFPGARLMFALTTLGALVLAAGTFLRARQITNARI